MQDQTSDDVDAYLIVYAIDQQSSFRYAEHLLANKLSKATRRAPVFLVANKGDLVRTQVIGTDGKYMYMNTNECFCVHAGIKEACSEAAFAWENGASTFPLRLKAIV